MASIEQHLSGWLAANVIDEPIAARIRAHEQSQAKERSGTQPITVLEAMVYLGLAVLSVGVAVLVGLAWPDMAWPVRSMVFAVPALLGFAAGVFFRAAGAPALHRAGGVAWLAVVPLAGATVGTAAFGLDAAGENAVLLACLTATATAAVLWRLSRGAPQVLGMTASLGGIAIAIASRPSIDSAIVGGLLLASVGTAAIIVAELRLAGPLAALRVCGAVVAALGSWLVQSQWGLAELFGPAVAVVLITLAVRRNSLAYIAAGVGTLFVSLIMTVARHVEDPAGVAVALIACGLLLIGAVVVLVRLRPWLADTDGGPA